MYSFDINLPRKCPCCGENAISTINDKPFDAFFCVACDHIWFDARHFPTGQSDYEASEKYETYYVGKPTFLWYHNKTLDYLRRNFNSGRILDFGCFDGFFTARLVEASFDAYGCDWNRKAIAHGRQAYGLGDRLSRDPEGEYDAIVALEVIEHFADPNDFLDVMLPHLSPTGTLVLSCPNKNSLYRPKTDAPPHHYSRFSERSLAALLARRGMKVEIQEREMSSFQLLRNFLGDSLRRDGPLLSKEAAPKLKGAYIHRLKLLANAVAGGASAVLRPIDLVAHALGYAYLSQFVVARSKTSANVAGEETS